MKLSNLKVLSIQNPLGIDTNPYFSWVLESSTPDTMQQSRRLVVTDEQGTCCWDTGEIESKENTFLPYEGAALKSRTRYTWTVTVTDNHGETASATAFFETAFLDKADWQAQWARSPYKRKKAKPGFGKQEPATMFRQRFTLREKPVKARLYATCHGIYEMLVNGERPDQRSFAPEHTTYEKYLCYQTYDVTGLCRQGENVLGMYVGDGWYLGAQTLPNIKNLDYAHAVLFQLEITYADGTGDMVCSGKETKAGFGPVRASDLFAGELYDANLEQPGWAAAGFDDSGFQNCTVKEYGYGNLRAQPDAGVEPAAQLPVVRVLHSPKQETILDFGQNMAGRVRMYVAA